jgi:mannose-1-phosphate guanylyltransferase
MSNNIFGVILAGGSGTRLWPLSRKLLPKQFLRLGKEDSLFEKTVSRITPLTGRGNVVVVTNKLHAFGSGCRQLEKLRLLIEPEARNTAPAIGLACLYLLKI